MTTPTVLLFPGQGLQFVGMGRSLAQASAVARATFAEADAALGFALSRLCWDGPDADLAATAIAQPAILTHAIAALRAFEGHTGVDLSGAAVVGAAGHSLGEWTALVAAGALDFATAVRLVHLRGRLMQDAVPAGEGAMAAILGLDRAAIAAACAEAMAEPALAGQVAVCAAFNDAAHTVVSGHAAAVARAGEICLQNGAMRAVPLPVSAPFHSPLMAPAQPRLHEALAAVPLAPLRFPVRSTVTPQWLADPGELPDLLRAQLTGPVLWQEAVAALAERAGPAPGLRVLAFGPAAAVPGLVKRTVRGWKVAVVSEAADLPA